MCGPDSPFLKVGSRGEAVAVPSWLSSDGVEEEPVGVSVQTLQPKSNISLPETLNSISSTLPNTVVVENLQSG